MHKNVPDAPGPSPQATPAPHGSQELECKEADASDGEESRIRLQTPSPAPTTPPATPLPPSDGSPTPAQHPTRGRNYARTYDNRRSRARRADKSTDDTQAEASNDECKDSPQPVGHLAEDDLTGGKTVRLLDLLSELVESDREGQNEPGASDTATSKLTDEEIRDAQSVAHQLLPDQHFALDGDYTLGQMPGVWEDTVEDLEAQTTAIRFALHKGSVRTSERTSIPVHKSLRPSLQKRLCVLEAVVQMLHLTKTMAVSLAVAFREEDREFYRAGGAEQALHLAKTTVASLPVAFREQDRASSRADNVEQSQSKHRTQPAPPRDRPSATSAGIRDRKTGGEPAGYKWVPKADSRKPSGARHSGVPRAESRWGPPLQSAQLTGDSGAKPSESAKGTGPCVHNQPMRGIGYVPLQPVGEERRPTKSPPVPLTARPRERPRQPLSPEFMRTLFVRIRPSTHQKDSALPSALTRRDNPTPVVAYATNVLGKKGLSLPTGTTARLHKGGGTGAFYLVFPSKETAVTFMRQKSQRLGPGDLISVQWKRPPTAPRMTPSHVTQAVLDRASERFRKPAYVPSQQAANPSSAFRPQCGERPGSFESLVKEFQAREQAREARQQAFETRILQVLDQCLSIRNLQGTQSHRRGLASSRGSVPNRGPRHA